MAADRQHCTESNPTSFKLLNGKSIAVSAPTSFGKAIAHNWRDDLSQINSSLRQSGISIEDFFKLERTVSFKLSALLGDANELHKIIVSSFVDISGFVERISRALLPSAVYRLEEYGLPRMISKKIHAAGLIDFEDPEMDIHQCA